MQAVDRLGDIAVQGLQVEILTTEQPSSCYLSKNLVDSIQVAAHDIGQSTINNAPMLRLSKCGLDVRPPEPVSCNLEKLLLRVVRELLAQLLEHLLGDITNAIWHSVQYFFEHREVLIRNIAEILEIVDESCSCFLVLERHVACHIGVTTT